MKKVTIRIVKFPLIPGIPPEDENLWLKHAEILMVFNQCNEIS
jgi:hypothetical protein